ncbi:MAG: glycosyltransferase family 2 protein [Micropruina sp.]|nr:glycosyltransferase family 2 protein [Micropruina sp.]
MKLVMTLLVRDEADIVAAVVEHHLAQGVDLIIATDNGSLDGTRDILARYQSSGRLELHDYVVHDKKQGALVSAMASRAYSVHHADWVINVDADEFFLPIDRTITLRQALERTPKEVGSFTVPVINMTGHAARFGSGLDRLIWRDHRPADTLFRTAGLHAHPTDNAVHVGFADVSVSQGNHFVNMPSAGRPAPQNDIEVLHFPWRSWRQFGTKVENAGRSYASNPKLRPSPRHHGMRDYRLLLAGRLEESYLFRHPSPGTLGTAEPSPVGLTRDDWLISNLKAIDASNGAVAPPELRAVLSDPAPDPYGQFEWDRAARAMASILALEAERSAALTRAYEDRDKMYRQKENATKRLARSKAQVEALEGQVQGLKRKLAAITNSRSYRLSRRLSSPVAHFRRLWSADNENR